MTLTMYKCSGEDHKHKLFEVCFYDWEEQASFSNIIFIHDFVLHLSCQFCERLVKLFKLVFSHDF